VTFIRPTGSFPFVAFEYFAHIESKKKERSLRFSREWLWRFSFSEIWGHIVWYVVTDVSEESASLKKEATRSSKILVAIYQTTRGQIPEDATLQEKVRGGSTDWKTDTAETEECFAKSKTGEYLGLDELLAYLSKCPNISLKEIYEIMGLQPKTNWIYCILCLVDCYQHFDWNIYPENGGNIFLRIVSNDRPDYTPLDFRWQFPSWSRLWESQISETD
jgi:hypothetical protein